MPVKHLSYSSVNTYMLCPKSWEFRYIIKPEVPLAAALPFGTAIHKAVQTYISAKALYPGEVRPLHELWPQCWQDALAERKQEIKWDKAKSTYDKLGLAMLKAPDVAKAIEAIKTLGKQNDNFTEYPVDFSVPGVSVPVIGYIDFIASDSVPVDLKTASRKWSGGKEHFELQPDFYLIGLNQLGSGLASPNNTFRYYILTKTKSPTCQVLETTRSWSHLFWTMQAVNKVWKAIKAGSFPPNVSGWKCKPDWCEYWQLCRGR